MEKWDEGELRIGICSDFFTNGCCMLLFSFPFGRKTFMAKQKKSGAEVLGSLAQWE